MKLFNTKSLDGKNGTFIAGLRPADISANMLKTLLTFRRVIMKTLNSSLTNKKTKKLWDFKRHFSIKTIDNSFTQLKLFNFLNLRRGIMKKLIFMISLLFIVATSAYAGATIEFNFINQEGNETGKAAL